MNADTLVYLGIGCMIAAVLSFIFAGLAKPGKGRADVITGAVLAIVGIGMFTFGWGLNDARNTTDKVASFGVKDPYATPASKAVSWTTPDGKQRCNGVLLNDALQVWSCDDLIHGAPR